MLTQLDVINQCLASMALAPITAGEIAGNPYAQAAEAKLNQNTEDTLAKGWWFNERLITTSLPAGLLRVEGNFGRTLSWRGAALGIYDHTTSAYLSAPYPAKTLGYVDIPFADLPPPLQAYIAALTVVSFQVEFDGSETKMKQLAGEVSRALAVLQEVDRNSRTNFKRLWELLAYGWWFNTVEFTAAPGNAPGTPPLTLSVQGPPQQPLFLNPDTGTMCATWTGQPITSPVARCRAVVQVRPEALPAAAAEWLRKASALDAERESLNPDPRILAELNDQLDRSFASLRRENGERMILREQSREFQARGWWFNTLPLEDCIVDDGVLEASFTTDVNTGAVPLTVQFTAGGSTSADRWLWEFGDGTTSSLRNPQHTYASSGAFSATLTVFRRQEQATSAPFTLNAVPPLGILALDFSASVVDGVSPLIVNFTGTESNPGAGVTLGWDFENNGSIDASGPTATRTYTSSIPLRFTPRLVGTRADDAALASVTKPGFISVTRVIDLNANGGLNVGSSSSVGVTLSGLDPAGVYELSLPPGRLYTAWSPFINDAAAASAGQPPWSSYLEVTRGNVVAAQADIDPRTVRFGVHQQATAEAARLGFGAPTITGYAQYTFWMFDPNPPDDRGGLSVLVRRIS